jgi:3-phosphoshikimate 1-carboxyvinyltransferase
MRVPGDKSIAHRALILAALAEGESTLKQVPDGTDVLATQSCLRALGVEIARSGGSARVAGIGLSAMRTPLQALDCANSGTTMRLLAGTLSGGTVSATLVGDGSLLRRPMSRVVDPLLAMGARIRSHNGRAPLEIEGTRLTGSRHCLPVASAQVKSALLLAGLQAEGITRVEEPIATRDHTERLLQAMGATIRSAGLAVEVEPQRGPLQPLELVIPGDFSSAAFWFAAAAIRPGCTVRVEGVGLNPSRTAFLQMLEAMGSEVVVELERAASIEPAGSVSVTGRGLRSLAIGANDVAAAIDEIPILMVVATQADGTTSIEGAGELRVKESDRIHSMTDGLRRMGATVEVFGDSLKITGPSQLRPANVDAFGDHRVAMALAIAGLWAGGSPRINGAQSADVSYPGFFTQLEMVAHG